MDARELKDHATEFFRKGKFSKAAEAYLSLTKVEPKELQHYIKLGDSYRRDGQKEKAIEAYREAVDGYARQGVMIKAIATCKLILEIDPAHKRAQEALADLCAKRYAKPASPVMTPPQPKVRGKALPTSIELDEGGGESLELDDGRVLDHEEGDKQEEAKRPEKKPEKPRPPPAAPVARSPVAAVELPENTDGIELDMGEPAPIAKPPPKPSARPAPPQQAADIEIDLAPEQPPASPLRSAAKAKAPEILIEVGGEDDAEELEVIDAEELPPGITLITAETSAEEELLQSMASAAQAPSTAMAAILASATDEPSGEVELFPGSSGDTGRISKTGRHHADPFTERLESGTPRPTAEEQEAAQLAEEAAFDLVPDAVAEKSEVEEAPPAAIPTSDLSQEAVPLFSGLPNEAFIDLLEQLTFRRVPAGEAVIHEGDAGKSIYVLASGRARVVKGLGSNHAIELATLEEGAFFGEMALLNGATRVASVVATTDSEVLELTETILRDLTRKHPSVGESLKQFYRQRLLANVMAMSPLFRAFDKADKKSLVEKFKLREVQNGEQVIKEGQPADGLYVVMHGTALVTKHDAANTREVPLAVLKEGDVFGEMSLLTRRKASATVTAKRKTLMLRLPKASFDELMFTHPAILEVVSELSDQRTRVNEQILSGAIDAPREALAFL